jgi:trigger factor
MKVNVEDVNSVKKILHIEIPAEKVMEELNGAYSQLKKNAKIKGFRPGKAPRSVLERLYKKDVQADVASKLIQSSFADALKETKLNIIGSPLVDPPDLNADGPYSFDATVEVNPELDDIEIKGLELKRTNYKVRDEDVDIQLKVLQQNMAKQVKIEEERPVQKGDFAVIDYEGFKDGKPYEATSKTENFTLKVGSGQIAKEFDEKLVGMKSGEAREISVTFPEDYFNEKLKNQRIDFQVTLREIRKEEIAELDDEFAKSLGKFETLENLKNMIKDNLTQGYEKRIEQELNEQVFEALISKTSFELPEIMVNYELENIISDTERRFSYQNRTMEDVGLTREKLQEQYRETAEKQVRRHILLSKVVEQEKLECSAEELEKGFEDMARTFNQPVEQIKGFYDQSKDQLEFFKHTLLEKQAIKLIIDNSRIVDVEPEKMKPAAEEAASVASEVD